MTLRITYFDQDPKVATKKKLPNGYVTEVTSIAASVINGRTCVVTMDLAGRIRVWDPNTGVKLRDPLGTEGHDSAYWAQDWNSIMYPIDIDGQAHVVVSASFADIQCWNLATGQQLCTAPDRVQTKPRIWLESMIVRKGTDGRLQVITVIEDGHVYVLDPTTGRAIMPSQQAPVAKLEQIVTVPSVPEVLACTTWNGEVLSWDAETMTLGVKVTPTDSRIEEILGFIDEDGAPCLAAAVCDPVGVLERRNLATGETMDPWAASWIFTLADTPEFGPIAATVADGVFQARRLCDGECVLELPCSIAGLWRVLPCTNAHGDARWACFFASELCMLDPANGRWSEPIVVTSPVRGKARRRGARYLHPSWRALGDRPGQWVGSGGVRVISPAHCRLRFLPDAVLRGARSVRLSVVFSANLSAIHAALFLRGSSGLCLVWLSQRGDPQG